MKTEDDHADADQRIRLTVDQAEQAEFANGPIGLEHQRFADRKIADAHLAGFKCLGGLMLLRFDVQTMLQVTDCRARLVPAGH